MTHIIKTIVTGLILFFSISKVQSQAIFTLENVTAGTGSSFCMEVTAENLQDIFALQFSINWDPALLELTSIQNLNPNFSGTNINTSASASGISTISFFGGPVSMPDNDVFFEMCFDVIGTSGGSTDVLFTGNPTPIEVKKFANPNFNIGLNTQGSIVTFPTPLTFSMPDTLVNPGATFCIPFTVENFDNLESVQFGINWDPTVMTYNSVTAFNLSDLDAGSFGVINAALGQIGFSWNDDDSDPFNGVTVPDGTVIFEMCFTAVGSVNDMTTILINDNPTMVEVVEFGNTTNIGVTSAGGTVNLQQTIFITNNMITQPNCFDANGGGINISIAGGTNPYTYLWSNDSTTQDLSGIGIGTYTVTITDSNIPVTSFITSFNVVGDFVAPIADAGGLDTISCADPTTILDGSGSSVGTAIIYEWTHDGGTATILNGNTNMPTVNALGVYELVVTDTLNGCTAMDFGAVTGDVVPPTVDAGEPDTLNCAVTEIQLNGTVDPAGNYTYAWTTSGNGNVSMDGNTLTPTIDGEGIYELLVTEMGTGCSATDQVEIALNDETPTADAGTMAIINCTDTIVVLDGTNSSTGNDISYQWTGLGTIIDETTLTPTVETTGTFTLIVTNTSSQCTAESMVMVNDDFDVPTAVISDMNDEINCTTNSVVLDGAGSSVGNDFTYLWTTTDGNVAFDSTTLSPTVDVAGEYVLVVTDTTNGCFTTDTTIVTQDANIPTADAGPNRTIDCQTLTVQLDGSESSLGAQYKYLWIGTPGSFVTDSTFIAPVVNAGGTYTLQVTDTVNNCISTSSVTVFWDTIAPVSVPLAPSFISCSQPEIILLGGVADIGTGLTFGWTSNTTPFTITGLGDAVVSQAGTFCLTQTNISNGCESTTCVEVFENTIPPIADAGNDFALDCEQTSAPLDGTNSSTGTNYIYQWVALSGNNPTAETTLTPSISSAGEYLIIVTDTINGCMDMDTVEITQSDEYPIVEAGANGTITCYDPEITLDASLVSSSGPDFLIEWVAGLGSGIVSGGSTLTPVVNEPGPYILTITNIANNCSATDQVLVSSNNTPPIAMVAQDSLEFDCNETSLILDGTGSTTSGVDYLWKTVDGFITEGDTSLMPTVVTGGHYSLCVTNPNNGCSDTATVFVAPQNPIPDIVISSPGTNLTCTITQVTMDASSSTFLPNQVYQWTSQNGNFVSGQNSLIAVVDAPAFYNFVVTDTITGCMYGDNIIVLIDSTSVFADAMADGNIDCQTDTINLEATVTTTSNHVVNAWSTMNGNILTVDTTQLMIQVNAAGIYQFIATDTITGCADTSIVEVLNDTNPPIANAGMDMEIPCNVNSIFLDGSASSSGTPFVYLWTTVNGNIVGSATDPMLEVDMVGTYFLQVTDTTNNCIAIDEVEAFNSQAVTAMATTPVQLDCGMLSISLDGMGSSTGTDVVYLWTTGNGNIVSGATSLAPEISSVGSYLLSVVDTVSGCSATTSVEVTFNNSFPNADAGADFSTCETMDTMAANLPTDASGLWLSLGAAIPSSPASPTTEVTNLQIGENILVWTLSAIGCPEYSSDTVIVLLENVPQAMDDSYVMQQNEVLDFIVGTNDNPSNGQIQTLTNVVNGTLIENGSGIFTYTPNPEFFGLEEFEYELCSDACPDICDIATVSIAVNERIAPPIDSLIEQNHNTITPNEDGLNDFFVFDVIEEYPNEFPNNEFIVFNRWGSIVYEAKPYNNDWNGTNKNGKPLPEGTYYYILRLDFNAPLILKGDVTILR